MYVRSRRWPWTRQWTVECSAGNYTGESMNRFGNEVCDGEHWDNGQTGWNRGDISGE